MKFLIWAWDYGTESGGGIALHRLAHNLATLGHDARLTCSRTAAGWLGACDPDSEWRKDPQVIGVYPEIVQDNPLQSSRVVRWLLNKPGFFGVGGGYDFNDLLVTWDQKYTADPYRDLPVLTAYRDLSHFRDIPFYRRVAFRDEKRWSHSYIVRKADKVAGAIIDGHHQEDAIPLDGYSNDERLIHVFNLSQRFTCYDGNTMLPTLAGLCGVPEIVMPNGGATWTREQCVAAQELSVRQTHEFIELCERHWA